MKKIQFIAIVIMAAAVNYLIFAWTIPPANENKSHVTSDSYKRLMRYHGTDHLIDGHNGDLYFYRDGRKCYVRRGV